MAVQEAWSASRLQGLAEQENGHLQSTDQASMQASGGSWSVLAAGISGTLLGALSVLGARIWRGSSAAPGHGSVELRQNLFSMAASYPAGRTYPQPPLKDVHGAATEYSASPELRGPFQGPLMAHFAEEVTSSSQPEDLENSEMRQRGLDARNTSFFSRNLPEERKNARTYYDIEGRGEVLIPPDRADEWGEELTDIGRWQRTNGPIYIQGAGGLMLVAGFANYFVAANANGLSSPLWTSSIFVSLLGFALQRKTS